MAVPAFRLSTSKVPLDDLFCVLFLSLSMIAVRLSLRRRAVGHFQSCRPWVYCNGVSFLFFGFFCSCFAIMKNATVSTLMCCAHTWKSPSVIRIREVTLLGHPAWRSTTPDCSPKRWCHFSLPEAIFKSFHCSTSLSVYDIISFLPRLVFHASKSRDCGCCLPVFSLRSHEC